MNAFASPPPSDGALEVRRAVQAARAATPLHAIVLAAPARSAEFLLGLGLSAEASYFAEPGALELVGLGRVRTLSARGAERFRSIREQAERVFAELPPSSELRLFGGFAFQAGRAESELWRPFGEAFFALPRLTYERHGDSARLTLVVTAEELRDGDVDAASELAARVLAALHGTQPEPLSAGAGNATLREAPGELWRDQVRAIRDAIARGELEKLVLARRIDVELGAAVPPARVLERLRELAPKCVRFAFDNGGPCFLGAAPERLVSKRGTAFETEAVAGSVRVGAEPTSRLLESLKDREEQAIVLRKLLRDLQPLAESIEHAAEPEMHVLKHVAHLRTRVRGTLNARRHVLELVERLHPTPAVAGVPTERALQWIAEHEVNERGWYAGPVGWMDGQGNGDFVVALRSGVLSGNTLAGYAGAGIVRGSEAESELAETRWKLAALLDALGVER